MHRDKSPVQSKILSSQRLRSRRPLRNLTNNVHPFNFTPDSFPEGPSRFEYVQDFMENLEELTCDELSGRGLRVKQAHGPGMLQDIPQDCTTVMQHERASQVQRTDDTARRSTSEFETIYLARSIDLRRPVFLTTYHLLCTRPSMEVDLRLLYCLIYVENEAACGMNRQNAQNKALHLLAPVRRRGYKR